MQIGLISDIHAHYAPLKKALNIFAQHKVDQVLCLGDIAGYGQELQESILLLEEHNCKSILGNHELWHLQKHPSGNDPATRYFKKLPAFLDIQLCGKSIFAVHASPPESCMEGIRLLDKNAELDKAQLEYWKQKLADFNRDILLVGHTHQVFDQPINHSLIINPGSTTYNSSCAILTLPDIKIDYFPLTPGKFLKTWNWGINMM